MSDLLPPLKDVIERYALGAKKSLGQHFLLDLNITRKIVRAANVSQEDTTLEIGPGPGGLTRALLETGARVIAVERDRRCIAALNELCTHYPGKLDVIEADALEINEPSLIAPSSYIKIIANLPYNISTELLLKWLKASPPFWSAMTLMFQKEVADRILARPGSKSFGRLSVIAQILASPARAFDLPARAFTPPPKVDSSVILFKPPQMRFDAVAALERVTQAAFSQRRKMLRSSLKPAFGSRVGEALLAAGAQETQRAEELTIDQFKSLALQLESGA